ncbi:MAG: NAD-dependent deacylase [Pseudomonadota bacterium]
MAQDALTDAAQGKVVVLTGAGVSAESGLATFRDAHGIWARYRIEDVATPEAFARDPVRVLEFYNLRRAQAAAEEVVPNDAHRALARLEREWMGEFLLVTQNVDDLHEQAGSGEALVHMHGELHRSRCQQCGTVVGGLGALSVEMACEACGAVGGMRPNVVWFGEMPVAMDRIHDALEACALFVSIGTSGNVYPAAGFVRAARAAGAYTLELNLEPSQGASSFHQTRQGPASTLVPSFVDALLAGELSL